MAAPPLDRVCSGGVAPPEETVSAAEGNARRIWDPVVRLFHWSLVIAFVAAWGAAEEFRSLHETLGYFIVSLLVVRTVWGFVGTRHARFSDFVYRPTTVVRYLGAAVRFRARRYLGHNPIGGAMAVALMVMLAAICTTGIMMTTDAFWGVRWMRDMHELAVNLTIVLIGLHLAGVAFASFEHRENLVKAMITGRKRR